jgi:aldose 1-epimerase
MIRLTAHQTPLSGRQYTLLADAYTATIASVGASLRVLQHRDRDLVVPFEADQLRPVYRGAILAPWPNRVVEGRYA